MKKTIIFGLVLLAAFSGTARAQERANQHEKHIRLIALALPFSKDNWMLQKSRGLDKDYTAQDVLEMIEDLKPNCLERFITGCPDPRNLVPVRKGHPKMTVLEFLDAAIAAGDEGCHIIPKLNLRWLASPGGEKYFWEAAQALYDLPLSKPIRNINLDVWDIYCNEIHTTPQERAVMFKRLRDIGYEQIGVNMTGLYRVNDPQIDYADFNINKETWTVRGETVRMLKGYPNIKRVFLYIDYPGAMDAFRENDPDRQAQIYYETIFPKQAELDITFVYAILQDSWDATTSVTSPKGPYGGKTMYDVTKELLHR